MVRIPFIKPIPSSIYRPSLRVIELERENHQLRKQLNKVQKENGEEVNELKQIIQDLKIQIAELQQIVFKKRATKKEKDNNKGNDKSNGKDSNYKPRSRDSYRREKPKEYEVTKQEDYFLEACTNCGGSLEETVTKTIYIEDIPEIKKEVIKQLIHVYLCLDCNKEQSKIPVPKGHHVKIGRRVRSHILHHTYILNTSYRDIVRSLWDYYHIKISEGEIQKIQEESAKKFLPTYNDIHEELLEQESVNCDESSWAIRGIKNYIWGLFSPTTDAVLFFVGSRGKTNIEKLLKDFKGCLTTDCYAAYKNLLNIFHQICWVHILRNRPELSEEQQQSAKNFHYELGIIYQKLKQILDEPFDENKREKAQKRFLKRLRQINKLLPCDTPKKLKNIKLLTQEYEQELFTCLQFKTALPENNLAERNLRHVVLKRKRSFGSQSEKGARIYAINCSVMLTLWRRYPETFFQELEGALGY